MIKLDSFYFPDGIDSREKIAHGLKLLEQYPNQKIEYSIIQWIVDNYTIKDISRYFVNNVSKNLLIQEFLRKDPGAMFNKDIWPLWSLYTLDGREGEKEWILDILQDNDMTHKMYASFLLQILTYYQTNNVIKNLAINKLLALGNPNILPFVSQFQNNKSTYLDLLKNGEVFHLKAILEYMQSDPSFIDELTYEHMQPVISLFNTHVRDLDYHKMNGVAFNFLRTVLNQKPELAITWYEKAAEPSQLNVLLTCQHPSFVQWLILMGASLKVPRKQTVLLKLWAPHWNNLFKIIQPISCSWMTETEAKAMIPIIEQAVEYNQDVKIKEHLHNHVLLHKVIDWEKTHKKPEDLIKIIGVKRFNALNVLCCDAPIMLGDALIKIAEEKYKNNKKEYVWNNTTATPDEISLVM